jgi:hypothetical protein
MPRRSHALVLALAVVALAAGCASPGAPQIVEPQSQETTAADKFAERIGYGVRGAALGALYGVAAAVSIAEGDAKGTMYVSYVTVPLFAFAGLGSGLANGAADPMRFPMLPMPGRFRSRK